MATNYSGTFNTNPYYDDFDETKNYQRILFRPGYAVQARELTQLQTQIQDQIKKFGKHVFVNGTVVTGGGTSFEKNLVSLKLLSTYSSISVVASHFDGKIITGATSGTKAIVKYSAALTSIDPITLIVKIISGDTFTAGENIYADVDGEDYYASIQASGAIGTAMLYSVNAGIFFIDGKFVYVEPQTIAVDKFFNTSSKKVGFLIDETIVDDNDDSTLLDGSLGTSNYAAPGADRYKVALTLTSQDLGIIDATDLVPGETYKVETVGTTSFTSIGAEINQVGAIFTATGQGTGSGTASVYSTNFVEIARIINGSQIVTELKTLYSEIGKELATRTYDESGDYTVKAWPIEILEHDTDDTKFNVALNPGKAYVKGYEFKTDNQSIIEFDKARTTATSLESDVDLVYGNYVYVNSLDGLFVGNADSTVTQGSYLSVELHNDVHASVSDLTTRIGTANVRMVDWSSGPSTNDATSVYKLYLFNIQMSSSSVYFKNIESIIYNTNTSGGLTKGGVCNIADTSKIGNTSAGDVVLSGTSATSLVFPLGQSYVSTLKNGAVDTADYYIQRTYTSSSVTTGSNRTFTVTAGVGEKFYATGGSTITDADTIKDRFHGVYTTSGDLITFSQVVISPDTDTNQTAVFTIATVPTTDTVKITVTYKLVNKAVNTKTISNYTIKVIAPTLNTTVGGRDSLGIADIENIYGVYNTGTTDPSAVTVNGSTGVLTWGSVSYTDVTENYTLDDGQRADFYDHGSIVLTGTAPTSSHYLLVVYKNYAHNVSNKGFYSVDSYSAVGYENIPTFTDPSTGISYNLRDCVDFRPRRDDNATTFSGVEAPIPTVPMEIDYSYYLGRFDKIIATQEKQFIVKRGNPSLNPIVPTDDSNGMTIYVLAIPPYTLSAEAVQVKYIDNKRYTMRDIGKLEKRISNLEYYTQLSLLEKQAKDTSISDSSNYEKFKNGFAVDPFTSHDIFVGTSNTWTQRQWAWWNAWFNGATTLNAAATNYSQNSIALTDDTDFNVAIDPVNQEMRAPFTVEFHGFDVSDLTNTERNGDLVTLEYTESTAISQLLASTYVNINPFNVIRFIGTVTLNPPFDRWVEVNTLPAINRIVDVRMPESDVTTARTVVGDGTLPPAQRPQRLISATTTVEDVVLSNATSSMGTNIVDVQYIPYIRSSTVLGVGRSFKPLARLYAFIDSTAIDSYITPMTRLTIENATGDLNDKQGIYETIQLRTTSATGTLTGVTARVALSAQAFSTDSTKRYVYIYDASGTINTNEYIVGLTSGNSGKVIAVTTYASGGSLIPDEYGNLAFKFDIPSATFKTGERTIRLIDNTLNDTEAQESIAEVKYNAEGTIQTRQETILTTRLIQRQRIQTNVFELYDPTAQTFFVDPKTYPNGMHVSSVDTFFRTKSQTVPVEMQIRRTANGYPSSVHDIPFAEVALKASDVNISNDAETATTFNFDNPIHLLPGEYSIVLLSNSNEYNVYVAEIGDKLLSGTGLIDKQPYIGSLFSSQNASTWTADQNKDLKFVIRRAVFESSGTAEFDIIEPEDLKQYQTLFVNASSVSPVNTSIVWEAKAWYGGSVYDSAWVNVDVNQDINYQTLKQVDARDASILYPALRLRATMTTTDNAVSPSIDAQSISALLALNTINNDSTGEASVKRGGNALAKYITKVINLNTGFEATNLNVTFDAYKPAGTDIKVYYKTLPFEKTTPIEEETWVEMVIENSVDVPKSVNSLDFKEHRFFPSGAIVNFVPQDNPISARFNAFQIKIVLLSDNAALSPRIRDLRIIALDS